jgi:HAMP domain-containing protein
MADHGRRYKRKIFVSQRIQGLFALYAVLSALIVLFFIGAEFFLSMTELLGVEVTSNPFAFMQTSVVQKAVLLVGWGVLCYSIAVVFEQNKMAGPLVNFHRSLRSVQAGDYAVRIKLRDKDYFKELAAQINAFVASVESGIEKDIEKIDELLKNVQVIKKECAQGGCTEDVKKGLSELERLLGNFKALKNMHGRPETAA